MRGLGIGTAKDHKQGPLARPRRAFLFRPRLGCTSCAHDTCKQLAKISETWGLDSLLLWLALLTRHVPPPTVPALACRHRPLSFHVVLKYKYAVS